MKAKESRLIESVWDYPRPPRVERAEARVQVVFNGVTIADSLRAMRVLETSHPPNYYLPPEDVNMEYLVRVPGTSHCEWKGQAVYYDLFLGDRRIERVAWSYPDPTDAFAVLRDHLAFYAGPMDACYVDGEMVTPQPGEFYGGWITGNIQGPFKGGSGTGSW